MGRGEYTRKAARTAVRRPRYSRFKFRRLPVRRTIFRWTMKVSQKTRNGSSGGFRYLRFFRFRNGFAEFLYSGNPGLAQTILGDVAPDGRRIQRILHAAAINLECVF